MNQNNSSTINTLQAVMLLSPAEIARAWENPDYRESLSDATRQALPTHPAGELSFDLTYNSPTLQLAEYTHRDSNCSTKDISQTQWACPSVGNGCATTKGMCKTPEPSIRRIPPGAPMLGAAL